MTVVYARWGFYGCDTGCEGYRIYKSEQPEIADLLFNEYNEPNEIGYRELEPEDEDEIDFRFVWSYRLFTETLPKYAKEYRAAIDYRRCVISYFERDEVPPDILSLVRLD